MSSPAAPTSTRRTLPWVVALGLVVAAAVVAVSTLGSSADASRPSGATVRLFGGDRVGEPEGTPSEGETSDGSLPEGTTPFDEQLPGVARLDPALLSALQQAARDAADEGIALQVNSGWRSTAHQAELLQEAIAEHGSEEEASRWVATPEASSHVSGDAVDVGPAGAAAWLAESGARYGLCPTYANEPWHVELRPDAVGAWCPPPYPDPTFDPRTARR